MGVILDTSLLIAFERDAVNLDSFIHGRTREPFGISVITASELLHGVHRADTAKRRIKRATYIEGAGRDNGFTLSIWRQPGSTLTHDFFGRPLG